VRIWIIQEISILGDSPLKMNATEKLHRFDFFTRNLKKTRNKFQISPNRKNRIVWDILFFIFLCGKSEKFAL